MRSTHRKTALAAAVLAGAAVACSHGTSTKPPVAAPTADTGEAPVVIVAVPNPEPTLDIPVDTGIDLDLGEDKPIDRLAFAPDPTGTGPQIALRFLRALQRRDDIAAAGTLTAIGRLSMSLHGDAHLRRVMADVANHARLATAGPCTSAARLNHDAAVVTCGNRKIVVHVADGIVAGVQLAPWHPRGDVYRGPHTHAYTALDL
ncbi:MAG: hypothetical protein QOJ34_1113 [Pseudonocardiales bacterium]|jgi:hypothetical protein|nr:hypothetical protein [Pseudonocardiales bacterium]